MLCGMDEMARLREILIRDCGANTRRGFAQLGEACRQTTMALRRFVAAHDETPVDETPIASGRQPLYPPLDEDD